MRFLSYVPTTHPTSPIAQVHLPSHILSLSSPFFTFFRVAHLLFLFFAHLSSTHKASSRCTNNITLPASSLLSLSYFLSLLIFTPEGDVCLLTSWSNASAGLRLAPITRAWQGAAVSTCQPNKHPLWHPPGCVLRGVSQPPSSGPLILWMAHSAYTSTRLLCSGQAAIVLPCTAILMTLILPEAFYLVSDMVTEQEAEEKDRIKETNTGQVWQDSGQMYI